MRPIPPGRKNRRQFRNAVEMLAWALSRYHYRRRRGLRVTTKNPIGDRLIAMATLTRVGAGHAQAILAASRRSVAEATIVNVRAMLEIWADFRLIAKDDSGKNAERAYLAGALTLLRREPNAAVESELRQRFGGLFDSAADQIAKKPFAHWTGRGRKAVVESECGSEHGLHYEVLSWDSHPVVQVALDMQGVDPSSGKFELGHRDSQYEVSTHNCAIATHILRDMWNEFVKQHSASETRTA